MSKIFGLYFLREFKLILKIFSISLLFWGLTGCRQKPRSPEKLPLKFDPKLSEDDRLESIYQLGVIAGTTGKLDLAEQQFKTVLQARPDHLEATHDLGLVYARKGNIRQAIEYFQRTLEINPDFAEAYYNLAISYHNTGQTEMGEGYLDRTLQIDPIHKKALISKAKLAVRRGEIRMATQIYSHYVKNYPTDMEIRAALGTLYFQQGLDENAKLELIKVVKRMPTPQVLYHLGVIYHRKADLNSAQKFYSKALEKDPNFVDCLVSMGELLERSDNVGKALLYFERAYGLEPDNEYIRKKVIKLRRS